MISKRAFGLKKDGMPGCGCLCRNPELIENYDKAIADTKRKWICHHRLETHNSDGERRLVDLEMEELIALNMYYDRPPEELIFLTYSDHNNLHNKGKEPWNKGKKTGPLSKETKIKMRENHKGMLGKHHSTETKSKLSESNKGKHWKLIDGKRVYY